MKKILLLLFLALVTGLAGAQTFTVENNGNQFTIKRSGSNLPAQTVRYRTVSLSALAGVHFTDASGTLAFNAGDTVLSVTVTETPNVDDVYRFQTTTSRSYRFEVLEYNGTFLASVNRSIEYGNTYQHTASYVNKSVTDLVYFDNSGNIKSGSGNKYLDVSYSSSSWIQVDDSGYNQAVHSVSTGELFHGSNALRTYLNNQNNKMYATVYFQQKEEQDGYQYIQILADNASTYDGNDPNGAVNDPSLSLYKACFILSYDPSGSVMSDTHYQFFPHRYDYVDKAAETSAGITHYEFDYDNSHLYQQKYKASSYNAANNGALSLAPSVKNLNVRFDAAGSGGDDWDFKNLKVRLALVDEAKPSPVAGNAQVSAGPYVSGTTVYVSVPFSEIVTATSSATLTTSWGTLSYYGGSGSNVLTFSGEIDAPAGTQLIISALSGSITDLAGNTLSTNNVYKQFSATVIAKHAISLPSETPNGTMTSDKATALAGETVTLTAIPDAGYSLVALDVMNGNTPVATSAGGNNTYTFVMPDADVTVGALFALPIDATNFPDEYFRNYLLAQDYGSDGLLTHEEIASITEMNLNSQQIADLTGIGYFVALKELSCSWNPLTTIDMSQNTALQVLDCHATALASLNVSQNTALTTLRCYNDYGNLPLSSLDVSHNPALSELDCHGCQLTSLDVSHNPALTKLDCHGSQLTSLDVSHNPALTKLDCHNCQLTSLDVSNNTVLHSLMCNHNQLTALDLSQTPDLFYLDCSHNQIAALGVGDRLYLETIVCEYNQLTALNVNGCSRLHSLKCSNNQINAVNMATLVASLPTVDNSYGNHGYFYVINLDSETEQNVITSTQVAMAIGKNWIVQGFTNGNWEEYDGVLAIDATNFPDENFRNYLLAQDYGSDGVLTAEEIAGITYINVAMKFISDMTGIEHFTALTKLDCFANHYITTLDVSHNTALTDLQCHNNQLTALDVSHNTALRSLYCSYNQLTALDVSNNTALTYLYCSSNQLTTLDVSNNTKLTSLECYYNQLTALDVSHSTALTNLGCSSNQLTALDVSNNTALTYLSCSRNQLTTLDVSNNTALRSLYCSKNQLTALDVSHNTALTNLGCSSNQLTALDVSNNTALTYLYCSNNQLTTLDVSNNTALTYLDCSNNQLTVLDVSNNTKLTSLECYDNLINVENMETLVASMPTVDVEYIGGNGDFVVIDLDSETEQNAITTSQVATARGKNWTVYGFTNGDLEEYNGSEPTTAVPGDVDGDGYVTTVDITAIYNYLLSSDETYISTSDVDGDGFITTTDITVIYNILLGSKGGVSSEDN
jgi:Leucine-rich repeat (LRR) protein